MILIGRYGDQYGRAGDQCCIRESWRVCYHGLANNLLIIMECRITKRVISLTAFSSDWERSDRIYQGYKTNKSEVPANDENPKKYCVRICQLSRFFQRIRLEWYSPLFNLLSVFLLTSWSCYCFSLGDQFIFIDNFIEINEMNHDLNCGQRYESECDPCSWMINLGSWKRTWKIQVWSGNEPWPLLWPDSTINGLSPVVLVSSIDNLI